MLEFYEAYADYRVIAQRCEQLVAHVAQAVGYDGDLSFEPPWRRETVQDAIRDRTGIDIFEHRTRDTLAAAMKEKGFDAPDDDSWAQLVDLELISKHVEPKLMQPRSSWTTRSSSRRSPSATASTRAWSSASRRSSTA